MPDSDYPDCHLGIFAKFWEAGKVKTRLSNRIGPQLASQIYKSFLETTLRRFEKLDVHLHLAFTPSHRESDFRAIASSPWQLEPQVSSSADHTTEQNDLGIRMHNWFANQFASGSKRTVLIGSDSPNLPASYLFKAFDLLESHDVVLGPAEDGGYYLIGLKQLIPDVFDGIHWSCDQVLNQTISTIQASQFTFALLPTWNDIDELDDLVKLKEDLESQSARNDPALQNLLKEISSLLAEANR